MESCNKKVTRVLRPIGLGLLAYKPAMPLSALHMATIHLSVFGDRRRRHGPNQIIYLCRRGGASFAYSGEQSMMHVRVLGWLCMDVREWQSLGRAFHQ